MARKNEIVEVHGELVAKTEEAICIAPENSYDHYWLPLMMIDDHRFDEGTKKGWIGIPRWLAEKDGLV